MGIRGDRIPLGSESPFDLSTIKMRNCGRPSGMASGIIYPNVEETR